MRAPAQQARGRVDARDLAPGRGPAAGRRARLVACIAALSVSSCSFDSVEPAPYVAPPTAPGACGTTDTLLPQLFTFVRTDKIAPLRAVLERFSVARGEVSLRTLVQALVRLLSEFGLEHTVQAVRLQSTNHALESLEPLALTALELVAGRSDGRTRYEATEAIATLVAECPAQDLLTSLDALVRFEVGPPDGRRRWISALAKDLSPLLQDPTLEPFLETFESNAERGKPAVTALIVQVLTFVADPEFRIERVETLLESALYPLIGEDLRRRIELLVARLDEIAAPQANVLPPLQRALRCMNARPTTRADLIGIVYDLITVDEVDLAGLLATVDLVTADDDSAELLDFMADVLVVLRDDRVVQTQLFGFVEALLREPDVAAVVPMLIELLEADVGGEVLSAVGKLLEGCGR